VMELEIDVALASASSINTAIQRAEGRTRRLLHNLKSLTAKTTQEVYYIAQQQRLFTTDPKDAVKYVAEEIRAHSEDAAKAFIEILKHQAAQKAEYTAFERLSGKFDLAAAERHDVHRVLMNVFYLFFGELLPKKVWVAVQPTRLQALFEYESIHVCIYYLVENAAKYIRPGSELNVTMTEDINGYVVIRFAMESLVIKRDETERIFEEGVSGSYAVDRRLNGGGIGLYLARAMAKLNRGTLTVLAGQPVPAGGDYARNTFVLALPTR
jgi:signal transduction histidine kinase